MIVKERLTREDGVSLVRAYSNKNLYIRKVGTTEVYSEAVDLYPSEYEYEETTEVIQDIED